MSGKQKRQPWKVCKVLVDDGELEMDQIREVLKRMGLPQSFVDTLRPVDGTGERFEAMNPHPKEFKCFPTSIHIEKISLELDDDVWFRPNVESDIVFDGEVMATTNIMPKTAFAFSSDSGTIKKTKTCDKFPFSRYFEVDVSDASIELSTVDIDGKVQTMSAVKMKATKTPEDFEEESGLHWQTD